FFAGPPLMGLVSQAFSLRVSFYVVAALLVLVLALLIPALARQFRMAVDAAGAPCAGERAL
ncbi:MAG: MFS transporter, partial [Pseudomonadota bacterium]